MRIAFIGQKGIPATIGGIERHVEELATRMAGSGQEVFVYVRGNYTDKNLLRFKGVKLIHLPTISTKHLDAVTHTFLATIHALFQPYDVIHYQAIGPTSLSWIIKILKPKTALIATFHCQDYYHQKWGWLARLYLKWGEKITCTVPDKTITVSKQLAKWAQKEYGRKTITIPNGSQVKHNTAGELLSQWNLKENKYILYVGRLIKHKGVHYLIEAFKQLEDTGKIPNGMKLAIVGEGFHTDEYVKFLKTKSEGRINIVFTGALSGEDLDQIYSHACMFVQPSEYEGMSLALLEAMGWGLAVLASDIQENKEALDNCGLFFEVRDVQDLKNRMAYLLNKPAEAERLGKLAQDRARQEFSWDSITDKIIRVYRDATDEKS